MKRALRVAAVLAACVAFSAAASSDEARGAGPVSPAPARADAAALQHAIATERVRPVPPRLPRAAFLSQPREHGFALAPDGRQVAWFGEQGGRRGVWLQALPDGEPRLRLARTDAAELVWSRDGRWLFLPGSRQLAVLAADGQGGDGELSTLGGLGRRVFVGADPAIGDAALVVERPARIAAQAPRWRLLRVQPGGRETPLHEDALPIVDAAIDGQGQLAWLMRAEGKAHVLYRLPAPGLDRAMLRCEVPRRCRLLGASSDGGVWMQGNVDADLSGLLHVRADGSVRRVHRDPRGEADLNHVALDPVDGEPRFLGYDSTVPQLLARSADDEARLAALRRTLSGGSLRVQAGGGRWLVIERGDRLRGERAWMASDDGTVALLRPEAGFVFGGHPQPRPDEAAMARKWPVQWTASDGRRLHGFVTLPPGVDVAHAPLVVSVHGGPFSLVRPDFSNDAQLLANRGYVVFQPNFRGSTGLGLDYVLASRGDFGHGRVQQDIIEGTRWLLANGVGDADRVAIVGASFGGYSALLGVTFASELFKAAVAGVPPADFGRVIREYQGAGQEMHPGIPMAVSMRALGVDPEDAAQMQRLAAQSPSANAAALTRPVLVLAGGEDERVPIRGVTHYVARLRTLGKDVTFFVDTDAGHAIADEKSREAYYFLMESLLHETLGGPEPEPASAELQSHLTRHLR
ncbi:S9 family peptidase [Arenimonas sp.]|uniref:S9 family peptidase n=1 Tax=Arenimonas sp. TaxID=1872635 RepID=UPI002E304347|nr:prolyl oligopeptidase family serine peptidase [Arenimonas sp.]HEX4854022.1 prolyl oligopeptidase family serine peptidase [Arenimonas sp.]